MFGANAHRIDVTTCSARPHMRGARRPKRSDSGPMVSWPRAPPMSITETDSCANEADDPRSAATSGSDGRYMSTVNAGSAASAPSMMTQRYGERARGSLAESSGMAPILSNRYDRAQGDSDGDRHGCRWDASRWTHVRPLRVLP